MLRPIIMVGCGGSGQKAVRYVRDSVDRFLQHRGWDEGLPRAWQFLGIDTAVKQEDPDIPFMPNSDYSTVSLAFNTYQGLNQALEAKFGPKVDERAFRDFIGWRPNPAQVMVPLQDGAGQLRAVGRAAGLLALQGNVRDRLKHAFDECKAGGPELMKLSESLQVSTPPGSPVPEPITIVIGSMAGGTGAGISLDVIDLIRRTDGSGQFPVLVAFTPDIFGAVSTNLMTANSAGFMSELLSAYWDNEDSDSALIKGNSNQVHTRGPQSVFIIGRKNFDGLDLGNSKNVYRAVGEALAAVVTSPKVQDKFFHYITGNWPSVAPANAGGYGFGDEYMRGVVSSFGSATISIGRDRFREYLRKLLHREIVEHLSNGYESVASDVIGENASNMAGQAKVVELARRSQNRFLSDCRLLEATDGPRQISEGFITEEIQKRKAGEIAQRIRAAFSPGQQQPASTWQQLLFAQATQVKSGLLQEGAVELQDSFKAWGSEILRQVLKTTTNYSAELSIPVVIALIEGARTSLLTSSSVLEEESKKSQKLAEQYWGSAQSSSTSSGKGNLQINSDFVTAAITSLSRSIALEWSARTYERMSVTVSQLSVSLLSVIEAELKQTLNKLSLLIQPQDGEEAVIQFWPRNDGVVPAGFKPSPVEFFLEDYSTWPNLAGDLLRKSLSQESGLPLDPVKAARIAILRGGFGGDGKGTPPEGPLLWVEGISPAVDPVWEPGQQISLVVADGVEEISTRIDAWMMRPSTELAQVLSEGLSSYLLDRHPSSGVAVANHQQRLTTFSQKLKEALNQSKPLMEVDVVMNSTVHPQPLHDPKDAYELHVQGFPFGVGHPARELTEQIIQAEFGAMGSVEAEFIGGDAESVLLTRFLKHPVNPSVVTSFTRPMAEAMHFFSTNPHLIPSSFWQWRRARVLENFIPLPDELRRAAIRGFAVGRILGVMTALPEGQNMISSRKGVFNFPRHLLTRTDQNNILPALLESMILVFAEAPIRGKAAFDAYGELVGYGMGGGLVDGFTVTDDFARILSGDDHGSIQLVDEARSKAFLGDPEGRTANALKYLDANLLGFAGLEAREIHPNSWRDQVGKVDPPDTLRIEILQDLISGYSQVREAVVNFDGHDDLGTLGGVS
jgi:hypothetical protein